MYYIVFAIIKLPIALFHLKIKQSLNFNNAENCNAFTFSAFLFGFIFKFWQILQDDLFSKLSNISVSIKEQTKKKVDVNCLENG